MHGEPETSKIRDPSSKICSFCVKESTYVLFSHCKVSLKDYGTTPPKSSKRISIAMWKNQDSPPFFQRCPIWTSPVSSCSKCRHRPRFCPSPAGFSATFPLSQVVDSFRCFRCDEKTLLCCGVATWRWGAVKPLPCIHAWVIST